ncbi:MAG: hypothetical protein LBM60_03625 [Clostridium sp.]|jgi:hypothetical protein|nr:hypothetical protein [Clostridium sp.]
MRNKAIRILDGITKASLLLIALFVGFAFLSAFLFTSYADDMESQTALISWDNILINLCTILLGVVLFSLIAFWVCKKAKVRNRILLLLVLGWYLVAGMILAVLGRTVPAADAMSVFSMAEALAGGDTSVIHAADSYISYYPQQIGLIAFYEVCIRIWNLLGVSLKAFHFLKCLNVLFACCLVFCQYRIVHLLFQNEKAICYYLCFAGANLPLLFYTSFVYGEVPSLTLFFLGIWLLLKIQKTAKKPALLPAFLSCLCFACSVLLRKNMLIPIVALSMVLLLMSIYHKSWRRLVYSVILAVLSFCILPFTELIYESRSGNEIATGVPPLAYVAMGMQEASRGSGWYNGFNFQTYQNSQMDTALTNEISTQSIQESLARFQESPSYAFRFYTNKFLTQWTDGTYACRQATLATFGGRSPWIQEIYDGSMSKFFIAFCNAYQNLLYLGCLLFFCFTIKGWGSPWKKSVGERRIILSDLYPVIGMIAVFGGFLFHMVWEANSRYIFPYEIFLLPYCALGLSKITFTKFHKQKVENNSQGSLSELLKQHTV